MGKLQSSLNRLVNYLGIIIRDDKVVRDPSLCYGIDFSHFTYEHLCQNIKRRKGKRTTTYILTLIALYGPGNNTYTVLGTLPGT